MLKGGSYQDCYTGLVLGLFCYTGMGTSFGLLLLFAASASEDAHSQGEHN